MNEWPRRLRGIFWMLVLTLTLRIPLARSAEVQGHFRTGVYTSRARLPEEIMGTGEIKSRFIASGLNLDVKDLDPEADIVSFDLRDRLDSFGKMDRQARAFDPEHTTQINEAFYQRPWDKNAVYFSLGRFALPEAGLYRHDGLEAGYRLNTSHRLSVFAGEASRNLYEPARFHADETAAKRSQFGAYWAFEQDQDLSVVSAVGKAPSDMSSEPERNYFYQEGSFLLGTRQRLTHVLKMDLQPAAILRQGYLAYQYLGDVYQVSAGWNRLATEDDHLLREIQAAFPPSKLDILTLSLVQQVSSSLAFESSVQSSRRTEDSRRRQALTLGSRYQGLAGGHVTLGGWAGARDDFFNRERFVKLQLDSFHSFQSLHLEQEFSQRESTHNELPNLVKQSFSLIEWNFFFNEQLRGATAYSLTQSELSRIQTFYLMIGYSFAGNLTPPPPTLAPPFTDG